MPHVGAATHLAGHFAKFYVERGNYKVLVLVGAHCCCCSCSQRCWSKSARTITSDACLFLPRDFCSHAHLVDTLSASLCLPSFYFQAALRIVDLHLMEPLAEKGVRAYSDMYKHLPSPEEDTPMGRVLRAAPPCALLDATGLLWRLELCGISVRMHCSIHAKLIHLCYVQEKDSSPRIAYALTTLVAMLHL